MVGDDRRGIPGWGELCGGGLGIDAGGVKQVLDFEASSSERLETVRRLIYRLEKRGVRSPAESPLLVVRNGSEAIKSAVAQVWPGALRR